MLRERTTMWASGVPRNWTNLSICQIDQLKMWYAYTDKIKADSLNIHTRGILENYQDVVERDVRDIYTKILGDIYIERY